MSLKCSAGGRDSDSFCTVSEAGSFLDDLPDDTTDWEALSSTQKEYRLKLAAQLMGYLPYGGYKIYCGQALCFPRRIRGNVVCVPCDVKETQALIAYSIVHRGLANRPSVSEDETGSRVTQVSLGGLLSVAFKGEPVKGGNVLDQIIRSTHFPVYLRLKKYLSQIRGGSIAETDDDDYPSCSTTTTTTTTCTTTTSSTSSTTTTV